MTNRRARGSTDRRGARAVPGACGLKPASALPLLDFRPGIAKRDGSVEDEPALACVGVYTEVPEAFELDLVARPRRSKARFRSSVAEHCQRIGIEVIDEGLSVGHIIRVLDREQPVVKPYLDGECMLCGHPVQRRLHLAAVGGVATACRGIVSAPQFNHLSVA